MSRSKAVNRLFWQYRTECAFGWYASNPAWRKELRELYPVSYVSAYHRDNMPEREAADHWSRVKAFNAKLANKQNMEQTQ